MQLWYAVFHSNGRDCATRELFQIERRAGPYSPLTIRAAAARGERLGRSRARDGVMKKVSASAAPRVARCDAYAAIAAPLDLAFRSQRDSANLIGRSRAGATDALLATPTAVAPAYSV